MPIPFSATTSLSRAARFAVAALALCCCPATIAWSQVLLPVQTLRHAADLPNPLVTEQGEPQFLQILPDGVTRLGAYQADLLALHDIDAAGSARGNQVLRAGGASSDLIKFAAAPGGKTYAFGTSSSGCRLARLAADGTLDYARELVMPGSSLRGGALCQGFAQFPDGAAMLTDFGAEVVEVAPDGSSQHEVTLAIPAGVEAYVSAMLANGNDLIVPGQRQVGEQRANWVGAFDRNGALRWQVQFAASDTYQSFRMRLDGDTLALALLDVLTQAPTSLSVRFARIDADGTLSVAPGTPVVLPSGELIEFRAREGLMVASFYSSVGRNTVGRKADGSLFQIARGSEFDIGPQQTLWFADQTCVSSLSDCQGFVDRVDLQGNTLDHIVLPQAFYVYRVEAEGARLAVAGKQRFLNGLGNVVEGSTYAAVLLSGQVPVEPALRRELDAELDGLLQAGSDSYVQLRGQDGGSLMRITSAGRAAFSIEFSGRLLAASSAGVWVRPINFSDNDIKLRLVSPAGTTLVDLSLSQLLLERETLYAADANDSGGLWVLTQDAAGERLRLFGSDGSVRSDHMLPALPSDSRYAALAGNVGDQLVVSDTTGAISRRQAADGTLLHGPGNAAAAGVNWMVLDDTPEGALLLQEPGLVRRLQRNGTESWSTAAPAHPFGAVGTGCIRWTRGHGAQRLRVIQKCDLTPADIQVERWNLATGQVELNQWTAWNTPRFGSPSLPFNLPQLAGSVLAAPDFVLQVDGSGELLYAVQGAGGELLRFSANTPASLLDVPANTTGFENGSVRYAWPNPAGDVVVLARRLGLTGALGLATWHSGLLADGFE